MNAHGQLILTVSADVRIVGGIHYPGRNALMLNSIHLNHANNLIHPMPYDIPDRFPFHQAIQVLAVDAADPNPNPPLMQAGHI